MRCSVSHQAGCPQGEFPGVGGLVFGHAGDLADPEAVLGLLDAEHIVILDAVLVGGVEVGVEVAVDIGLEILQLIGLT